MVLWIVKNKRIKQQIYELMRDKGALIMRVGILEDALKEKENRSL